MSWCFMQREQKSSRNYKTLNSNANTKYQKRSTKILEAATGVVLWKICS